MRPCSNHRRHPRRCEAHRRRGRAYAFRAQRTLSKLTGAEIFLKFENLQFTASFKERGALNKLLSLSAPNASGA